MSYRQDSMSKSDAEHARPGLRRERRWRGLRDGIADGVVAGMGGKAQGAASILTGTALLAGVIECRS